jgi:hypothetical protein
MASGAQGTVGPPSDGDDEAEDEGGGIFDVPTCDQVKKMNQKDLREQLRQRGLVMGGAKADQRARLLKALGHMVAPNQGVQKAGKKKVRTQHQ